MAKGFSEDNLNISERSAVCKGARENSWPLAAIRPRHQDSKWAAGCRKTKKAGARPAFFDLEKF
jgi:hypothetical protein